MKKIIALILTLTMVTVILPFAVLAADEGTSLPVGPNYGEWSVSGKDYTCSSRPDSQENFGLYVLGDATDNKVTLSADITVPITGQAGFMFGITDCNGDKQITQAADQYYLVCLRGTLNISVTRCDKRWVNWKETSEVLAEKGQTVAMSVTYTKTADAVTIVVTADGEEVLTYTDNEPLSGIAYGLATKDTQPLKNVSVTASTNPGTGSGGETNPGTGSGGETNPGTGSGSETNPGTGSGGETNPGTGSGSETNPGTGSGSETDPGNKPEDKPATGDALAIVALVMVCSLGAALTVIKKRSVNKVQ